MLHYITIIPGRQRILPQAHASVSCFLVPFLHHFFRLTEDGIKPYVRSHGRKARVAGVKTSYAFPTALTRILQGPIYCISGLDE